MIPIEELEKVLQGCISRTLKRVGRKEFIDLFNYLDKANELNAMQAFRIAELEAAIKTHREKMKRHGPHVPSPIDATLYEVLKED